jgi:hypothetical protein
MNKDHNARVTCTYCGKTWTERRFTATLGSTDKCGKCGDKNLVIEQLTKVDYYQGAPAFVDEVKVDTPADDYDDYSYKLFPSTVIKAALDVDSYGGIPDETI